MVAHQVWLLSPFTQLLPPDSTLEVGRAEYEHSGVLASVLPVDELAGDVGLTQAHLVGDQNSAFFAQDRSRLCDTQFLEPGQAQS